MKNSVEFERCADFLARMIEKYGDEVCLPNTTQKNKVCEDNENDCDRISLPSDVRSSA